MSVSSEKHFKIIVVGDEGVGKTTFVNRYKTGEFNSENDSIMCVEISPLIFNTTIGKVVFNIWDCSGKFNGLGNGYFIGATAAIIMFDVTSKKSFKSVPFWYNEIRKINDDIPIVLCGSKCDMIRKVKFSRISFHKRRNMEYFDISSKSGLNLVNPFLYLAGCIISKDIKFIDPEILTN